MQDSKEADQQRKRLEARGRPVPDHLYPPEIPPGYEDWLGAFWELCSDRQNGMSVGPIPAASIDRHTAGWPDHEAAAFRACIRAMDAVILRAHHPDAAEPEAEAEASDNPMRDAFRFAMKRQAP